MDQVDFRYTIAAIEMYHIVTEKMIEIEETMSAIQHKRLRLEVQLRLANVIIEASESGISEEEVRTQLVSRNMLSLVPEELVPEEQTEKP